jgi:ribosome modulation factor
MPQVVFELPPPSAAPQARRYIAEGFQANQHCKGRGDNPYPSMSRRESWWDSGWCEAELGDKTEPDRTELEQWLAGGNE